MLSVNECILSFLWFARFFSTKCFINFTFPFKEFDPNPGLFSVAICIMLGTANGTNDIRPVVSNNAVYRLILVI